MERSVTETKAFLVTETQRTPQQVNLLKWLKAVEGSYSILIVR